MRIIIDSSTLINLINGETLMQVSLIPSLSLLICDNILEYEILNPVQKIYVETLIAASNLSLFKSDVTLTEFSILKSKYDLGFGETECIAICKKHGFVIACDDNKARKCAIKEISHSRVIGSLYLIREAVRANIISAEKAKEIFMLIKTKGGFIPNISLTYFNE